MRIIADHSIFVTKKGLDAPIISTFIDDIKIITFTRSGVIDQIKQELTSAFSIVDMGPISFYPGLKVQRNREKRTIKQSQLAYINKVLNKFYLDKAHTVNTQMKKTALLKQITDREASASEKKRYQRITGSLIFSIVETKPDITFAISIASRFTKNLGRQHIEAVKTILRYLKDSREQSIIYSRQRKLLVE